MKTCQRGHTFEAKQCKQCHNIWRAANKPKLKATIALFHKKWPEYSSFLMMIRRCSDSKVKCYPSYGGRGITVCPQWLGRGGFFVFINDVGRRPYAGMSIGRKDNDGNYDPENCRWENPIQQANNTRRSRFITVCGERLTIAQWSRKMGYGKSVIDDRLKDGWSEERAVLTPVRICHRRRV